MRLLLDTHLLLWAAARSERLTREARRRAGRGGDKIVLIALTSYGQIEDKQRALNAGFDDHLTKASDEDVLFTVLNDLEKYSRSPAEPALFQKSVPV